MRLTSIPHKEELLNPDATYKGTGFVRIVSFPEQHRKEAMTEKRTAASGASARHQRDQQFPNLSSSESSTELFFFHSSFGSQQN